MGLTNKPANEKEYPVEFLYRDVLSRDHLLEALSFFLIRVPEREAVDDKPASPAFTIFPRFHQSRLVRRVADDITTHYAATGEIGKKYLVEHSAGSGKTLSICWLAERLHSLFKPGTNEKLVDITFILTDRRSLNKNVGRHRELHAPEGSRWGREEGRPSAEVSPRTQAHHCHNAAEVCVGTRTTEGEPGSQNSACGFPDR